MSFSDAGKVDSRRRVMRATTVLLLLPGALTVYFAFNAGGFFPQTPAFGCVVLLLVLIGRVLLARDPFAGFGWPLAAMVAAMVLYTGWTLASGLWSHAWGRSLDEFQWSLLYLLAVVLFGSMARSPRRIERLVRGLALGAFLVCCSGLITRLLPAFWPTTANVANNRLSFPVTYWNALGLLAAVGIILALHLSASRRSPATIRVLAATGVPIVATTLYFTFSRGAIAAGILGLAVFLAISRPGHLLSALAATVPATAASVAIAYHAGALASDRPTSPLAIGQGHRVALAVSLLALAAGAVRLLLLPLDRRPPARARAHLPPRVARTAIVATVLVLLAAAVAAGAPNALRNQYRRFTSNSEPSQSADFRTRLTDPSNRARLDLWRVGWAGFQTAPFHGSGAGTFQTRWEAQRPNSAPAVDAHSLYVEVLDELGLVGFGLLAMTIVLLLWGLLAGSLRRRSTANGALFAAGVMWAVHAGVDWDWEMPVVTLWLFAAGGFALARRTGDRSPAGHFRARLSARRVALSIILLGVGVLPVLTSLSQSRAARSADLYANGRCSEAVAAATASIRALDVRPEPWEIIAYCAARAGERRTAARAAAKAIQRDPQSWEPRYAQALILAAGRRDPRSSAHKALQLNPRASLAQQAVVGLASANPMVRRAQLRVLDTSIDGADYAPLA